eukprot:m.35226 g.35226  ORF g.35226 m.35226 type:complete len:650 (-) comp7421_c1_seq1:1008-2957(-)
MTASEEANHLLGVDVVVEVEEARAGGEPRHRGHGPAQRIEEPSPNRRPHLPDRNPKASWCPLGCRVGREGEVRLGHADRKVVEPLRLVPRNVRRGLLRDVNPVAAVNVRDNLLDLLFDRELDVIQKLKVDRLLCSLHHGLCKRLRPFTTVGPVRCHHGVKRPGRHRSLADRFDLGVRVGREPVDPNHDRNAELCGVFDVAGEVGAASLEECHVLFGVLLLERGSRGHRGSTAVHLERTDRRNQRHHRRNQPRLAALHVEELLHSNVRPKAGFGHHKPIRSNQLERDLVGHDRRVSDRNVGKRPGVNENRGALHRLHQRWVHRVLEENRQRPCDPKVVSRHRVALLVRGKHHAPQPVLKVLRIRREREDGHELRRHRYVKLRLSGSPLLRRTLTDGDLAEKTVVGVHHPAPRDCRLVNVEPGKLCLLLGGELSRVGLLDPKLAKALDLNVREGVLLEKPSEQILVRLVRFVEGAGIDRRSHQVVRCGDGVDVASQVQVELIHRNHLSVATAGGASLDAKGWPLGRLTEAGEGRDPERCPERLSQPNRCGRLALAQRCGGDARHHNVLPIRAVLEPLAHVVPHLGLVGPVRNELRREHPNLCRQLRHRLRHLRRGNLHVTRDRADQLERQRLEVPAVHSGLLLRRVQRVVQ